MLAFPAMAKSLKFNSPAAMIVELPASLEPMKLSLVLVSLLMWDVAAETRSR